MLAGASSTSRGRPSSDEQGYQKVEASGRKDRYDDAVDLYERYLVSVCVSTAGEHSRARAAKAGEETEEGLRREAR